ncbi:MAG: RDD family protein [Methylophilaceae bacterium]
MEQQYAGFWIRTFAAIIDSVIFGIILIPLMMMLGVGSNPEELFGTMYIVLNLLLIAAIIALWAYKGATPGKMITKIKIVDAESGNNISIGKSIIRYIGYIIGSIPLCLGFLWVAFDKKKQGWHDKMAGSVVVKTD